MQAVTKVPFLQLISQGNVSLIDCSCLQGQVNLGACLQILHGTKFKQQVTHGLCCAVPSRRAAPSPAMSRGPCQAHPLTVATVRISPFPGVPPQGTPLPCCPSMCLGPMLQEGSPDEKQSGLQGCALAPSPAVRRWQRGATVGCGCCLHRRFRAGYGPMVAGIRSPARGQHCWWGFHPQVEMAFTLPPSSTVQWHNRMSYHNI